VFPGAAVSLYPVTKSGIERLFVTFLAVRPLSFSTSRKKQVQKQKNAGVNAGLLQLTGGFAQ
jgi:hypothetical protein